MAFKRGSLTPEQMEEMADSMASAAELFGKKDFGPKRPNPPKFNTPGDKVQILLTKDPYVEQQKEVGGSWDLLFLEKKSDGKWKPTPQGQLTEGSDRFELTQIVVEGKLMATGEDTIFYFDNKAKREALEVAMEKTDLVEGNAMQITRGPNQGRSYTWDVKIAAPKG